MGTNVVDVNGRKFFKPPQAEEKAPSSCTSGLPCSIPFHSWLKDQDDWVIAVAQEDDVYQAMKLSYESNKVLSVKPAARDGRVSDMSKDSPLCRCGVPVEQEGLECPDCHHGFEADKLGDV